MLVLGALFPIQRALVDVLPFSSETNFWPLCPQETSFNFWKKLPIPVSSSISLSNSLLLGSRVFISHLLLFRLGLEVEMVEGRLRLLDSKILFISSSFFNRFIVAVSTASTHMLGCLLFLLNLFFLMTDDINFCTSPVLFMAKLSNPQHITAISGYPYW